MTTESFFQQLDARIAQFDLLGHPFYKAWSAGELSRLDLREYARDLLPSGKGVSNLSGGTEHAS